MGNGNSKPAQEQSQHIFAADTPVRFSSELVDSLQNTPQSDNTRAKTLELQIQSRVHSELSRLAQSARDDLSAALEKAASEDEPSPQEPSLGEKIGDKLSTSSQLAEKQRQQTMSRNTVTKEIEELKKKLEGRKRLEKLDAGVEKAKEEVATCLRVNDRKPLDCWREVENFKMEVAKMEKSFVEKTVR